jgi:hypothetical protein
LVYLYSIAGFIVYKYKGPIIHVSIIIACYSYIFKIACFR